MVIIKELQSRFTNGYVVGITVRPGRLDPVVKLQSVQAIESIGLQGDRLKSLGGKRQVTFIQAEHLESISSFLTKPVTAAMVRRNIELAGRNLLSLKGHRFRIGEAIFGYSGECHPCSRMEEALLGAGGYLAE